MSQNDNEGLLFVYGECGAEVSEEEFNGTSDWYDNDHAPARLLVPGFFNATRYKATDSQAPTWLALYDMASPSVLYSDAYKGLAATAPDKERSLISRLALLNRRVFTHLTTRTHPTNIPAIPAQYLLVVSMSVQPELDSDFNKWYEEEHIAEIAKTPGWSRCRRLKLVDSVELAGKADKSSPKPAYNYLALHEFDNDGYRTTPEFLASIQTPWSTKILTAVAGFEARRFVIHKDIKKPE